MIGGVTAVAVALLLGSSPIGSSPIGLTDSLTPTILVTTENWGASVSLLNPATPAWGHAATSSEITVAVDLHGLAVQEWTMTVDAPTSFQQPVVSTCAGQAITTPTVLRCTFHVDASSGINPLGITVNADGHTIAATDSAVLRAGSLNWDAGYEVLDAAGTWIPVPKAQAITLLATAQSALRYTVLNTGTIPVRLIGGCSARILVEGDRAVCPLRGVRTAQSLAREYSTHVRLEDAAAGGASFDIRTGIRTFAGTFSLDARQIEPLGIIVINGSGLPRNEAFKLQYRIDAQAVLLGTSTTRSGTVRIAFPLRGISVGAARLNIEHDGLTIASLPFEVTRHPDAPDGPLQGALTIALATLLLIGLAVLPRVRALRARRRMDPSPDAIPAPPEPGAARRR